MTAEHFKTCPRCNITKKSHIFYLCHRCKEQVCVSCLDPMNTAYCKICGPQKAAQIRAAYAREEYERRKGASCAPYMGFMPAPKQEKKTEVKTSVQVQPSKVASELPSEKYEYIVPKKLSDLRKEKNDANHDHDSAGENQNQGV